MAHALLNRLYCRPGQRKQVVEILLESGRLFDDNPDCYLYMVTEDTYDSDVIWVVDLWSSEKAHAAALHAPELKPFIERSLPLLEGMPEQIRIDPAGGKGVPD